MGSGPLTFASAGTPRAVSSRPMSFFVKVIPPMKRARVHKGECRHCREGRGQAGQERGGSRPTYWRPEYPAPGYPILAEAQSFMAGLDFTDTGLCKDCNPELAN